MFPGIGGPLAGVEEEGQSRPASPGIPIPRQPLSRPHSPGKFRNEGYQSGRPNSSQNEDAMIHLEVIITPGQLKDIMKCEPSKGMVSRAGMSLKRSFPELTKAAQSDTKEKNKTHKKKEVKPIEAPPFDVKHNATINWKGTDKDITVQNEYMNVMKYIVLREGSIRRIAPLVQAAEQAYWKYASVIINRLQFDHSIVTEDIAHMRALVNITQEELSVALAHHRSLGVAVIEAVSSWRHSSQKANVVSGIPSVYYEGSNYLLKMATDTHKILDTQTMKMWLGFEPNIFLLPPAYHNPHSLRVEREEKRRKWIKGRDDWMQAQLENLRRLASVNISSGRYYSTSDNEGGSSSRKSSANPTNGTSRPISSKRTSMTVTPNGMVCGRVDSQSAPTLPLSRAKVVQHAGGIIESHSAVELGEAHSGRQCSGRTRSKSRSEECDVAEERRDENSSNEEEENEEEEDEDDSAMKAPKLVVGRSYSEQSNHGNSSEGEDDNHSESPSHSASSSASPDTSCSTYIEAEEDWHQLRDQCAASWPSDEDPMADNFWLNYDLNPLTVEAAVCFVDAFPTIFLIPPVSMALANRCLRCEAVIRDEEALVMDRDRLRSECRQYKEEVLSGNQLQIAMEELDTDDRRLEAFLEQQMLISRQQNSSVRDITKFQLIPLPRHVQRDVGVLRTMGRVSPRSSASRDGYCETSVTSNPFSVFLTATGDEGNVIRPGQNDIEYQVDIEALRYAMENRVEKERNKLLRIGDALVVVKNKSLRAGKTASTKKKRMNPVQAAIRLQSIVRGALVRSKLRRSKRAMQKMQSVIHIQKFLRMFLAKMRVKLLKKEYRREMMMLRKSILRKNKAAAIIQHFFRYVVFLANRGRYMKKYDIQTLQLRDPGRLKQISMAVVKIQKIYRGRITRKDLARYFRKLHKTKVVPSGTTEPHNDARMTQRRDTFSIAGSGGFKFRRKTDEDFLSQVHKATKPTISSDPKLLQLIQEQGDFFQTLITRDAEHMKVTAPPVNDDDSVKTEDRLLIRQQSNISLQQKRAYLRANSFGAAVVSEKNIMKTAGGGERHFIIDKIKKASDVRRKTNMAYVTPNVHKRPMFVRSGSALSVSSTKNDDDEIKNMLANVLLPVLDRSKS